MARKKTDQTDTAPSTQKTLEQELATIKAEREAHTAAHADLRGQLVEAEAAQASAEAAAVPTADDSPEWDVFYRAEKRVSQLRARIRAAEAKAAALAEAEAAAQRAIWQYALDRSLELASDATLRDETEEAVEIQVQLAALENRRNEIVIRAAHKQNMAVALARDYGVQLGMEPGDVARLVSRNISPIGSTANTADHSIERGARSVLDWVTLRAIARGANPRLDDQQIRMVNVGVRGAAPAVEAAE